MPTQSLVAHSGLSAGFKLRLLKICSLPTVVGQVFLEVDGLGNRLPDVPGSTWNRSGILTTHWIPVGILASYITL